MSTKKLTLRRPDVCSMCHICLTAGAVAWWDSVTRTVTCEPCHDRPETPRSCDDESPKPDANPKEQVLPPIKSGVAGQSALEEYQRLHANREALIDAKFGRFAGVVKFLTDDPQSITAWKVGSAGGCVRNFV